MTTLTHKMKRECTLVTNYLFVATTKTAFEQRLLQASTQCDNYIIIFSFNTSLAHFLLYVWFVEEVIELIIKRNL